jgi:hypothetical protein
MCRISGIDVAARAPAGRGNASDSAHVLRGTVGASRGRMLRFATLCVCLTAACSTTHPLAPDDIVGPYTGARTRFVVDSLIMPMTSSDARLYGTDLDGDSRVDNQLGMVISTLIQTDTADQHTDDRIASGELHMVVEIQADDLQNDDRAGVWVYGFGDSAVRPTGGEIVDGTFVPNFVRDTAPENTGSATLPMPLLADADTSRVEVPIMEISLVPDGNGGYHAQIHGAVRDANTSAREAVLQQLNDRPEEHRWMWSYLDKNHDGVITTSEWDGSLIRALITEDIELDGEDFLSFGIGFHLAPCPSGNCAASSVVDHCFDRVRDGDETDVDCGGSCEPCGRALACKSGADCQSGTCSSGGCTAPSCFDGIKNGFEASTDCGGACAKNCDFGQVCGLDLDCEFSCSASYAGGTGYCRG